MNIFCLEKRFAVYSFIIFEFLFEGLNQIRENEILSVIFQWKICKYLYFDIFKLRIQQSTI